MSLFVKKPLMHALTSLPVEIKGRTFGGGFVRALSGV